MLLFRTLFSSGIGVRRYAVIYALNRI